MIAITHSMYPAQKTRILLKEYENLEKKTDITSTSERGMECPSAADNDHYAFRVMLTK